MGSVR